MVLTDIKYKLKNKMTKKILLVILIFFWNFYVSQAENLDVKANIDSWEYNFAIEVNLIANENNTKIFYYTDGEWRMDNILEFKKWAPILIKETTTLNYYAIWENFKETLIKENKYKINYPKNLELSYENWKILIKNTWKEIVNLGYYKVETNNLKYDIYKNTFIDKWEIYSINYDLKENEIVKLIAPDNSLINNYKYTLPKKEAIEKVLKGQENKQEIEEVKEENNEIELIKNEILNNPIIENLWENIDKRQFFNSWETSKNTQENEEINKEENKDFDINNEIKTSINDNKNNNEIYTIIYIFVFITFWVTLYNIFLVIKNSKTKKVKTKKSLQKAKQK